MVQLTPDESRVLGVLIEKALTTPEQYPLSLNAVVNGANQKNNRDPVMTMEEGDAFEALEGLRAKGMVIRSDMAGSRVNKYRQQAADVLHVRTAELAILAELLLRGPQTVGELRGRASRMHPLESLEVVKNMLRAMQEREVPLVRELPPAPGSRAERFMQLLCPNLHPLDAPAIPAGKPDAEHAAGRVGSSIASAQAPGHAERIAALESEVASLRNALRRLAHSVGEPDPLAPAAPPASAHAAS